MRTRTASFVGVVSLVALSLLADACGGGGSSPPPESTYFILHTVEKVVDPYLGAYETNAGGQGVQGNMLSEDPGAIGSVTIFPSRFTDFYGYTTIDNARVPSTWKFTATMGPCGGGDYPGGGIHISNRDTIKLPCQVVVVGALDYGFLTDGSPVYTGGADKLLSGDSLGVGDGRYSADGRFHLQYQSDGNLVLYDSGGTPIWASDTAGSSPGFVAMQGDGNLVVYDGSSTPIWASNTAGASGSVLVVQADGDLSILWQNGQIGVWDSGTGGH